MSIQQIESRGIYHALPVFPTNLTGLTAIITGANGISGHYALRVLSQSPKRWTKIYCLSRRPPFIDGGLPDNVEHIALDFLTSPDEIAKVLKEKGVSADYIFFYSYVQPPPAPGKGLWSDAQEMVRVNSLLLDNFLGALKLANAMPKRFMLQTGAKNYGVHQGPTKVPQEESDPRVEIEGEPNFYYPQEDLLWKFCEESGGQTAWNIHMPGPILGGVPDAAMNAAFPLAVYATVCREMGHPLKWPGDVDSWQGSQNMSSAMMNAYQEEWAILAPQAANQKFNTHDNSSFTYELFWPKLASWYGIPYSGPQDNASYTVTPTGHSPRGYGGPGFVRKTFLFTEWAKRPQVQGTWNVLAEKHGLRQKELTDVDRVFGFLDGTVARAGPLNMSMDKSRKLGWHGFVDSSESLKAVFEDLVKIKMIPPLPSE